MEGQLLLKTIIIEKEKFILAKSYAYSRWICEEV